MDIWSLMIHSQDRSTSLKTGAFTSMASYAISIVGVIEAGLWQSKVTGASEFGATITWSRDFLPRTKGDDYQTWVNPGPTVVFSDGSGPAFPSSRRHPSPCPQSKSFQYSHPTGVCGHSNDSSIFSDLTKFSFNGACKTCYSVRHKTAYTICDLTRIYWATG